MAKIYRKKRDKISVLDLNIESSFNLSEGLEMKYYKCDISSKGEAEQVMNEIEVDASPIILLLTNRKLNL
jgi:hypothetical protein